jgi:hypothetical protein
LSAGAREQVPAVVGAVLLLLVGWIVARVMRALAVRGMQILETLVGRATRRPAGPGLRSSAAAFSMIVFWAVLLFFITAATQVLGLVTFTEWLARLLEYLPTLIAGLLIIAAGFNFARFVGDIVYAGAERLAPAQRTALARLAQATALIAALLVGADQIGIRVTWIAIIAVIVIASVLGGVMLAVSLGARGYVSNLIGAHYLRQALRIGESVRIAGHEGRILDVTATSLVLETEEGRVSLPGRIFHDEPIVLIARSGDG